MARPYCHSFLAFILKFLNLFQLFIGISIIIYSAYMLNQWNTHFPDSSDANSTISATAWVHVQPIRLKSVVGVITGAPFPWFIYAFMGFGVILCCISCTGHIAAEAVNGCCLCFYTVLKTIFVLLEVAFILFIALYSHWERDLPVDPTGEIDKIREFVESNTNFCEWVGIAVVVVQGVCLLLAVVLRAMVNSQVKHNENDIEENGDVRGKAWEPLLNPHSAQAPVSGSGNGKSFHSDIWSSRMREKYGLRSSNMK